ncbi:MAG: protein-disulfide reductase DsbD family protein [Alphaproteobacteria bacterium]|nr:protein-disulfide reductase DsbD family protein [Alphaproteobacteria bacterium]
MQILDGHGRRRHRRVLALLAVLALALMFVPGTVSAKPGAAESSWVRTEFSAVRLISPMTGAGSSGTVRLGLHFRLRPGWKIYWRSPGDAGVPPMIDWKGSRNLDHVSIRWPLPERYTIFGLTTYVYGGEVVLPIEVKTKTQSAALALRAHVSYLVCEKVCIPAEARLALDLATGGGEADPGNAALIDRYAGLVPPRLGEGAVEAPFAVTQTRMIENKGRLSLEVIARSKLGFGKPRLLVEGAPPMRFGPPRMELSSDNRMALFNVPVGLAGKGVAAPDNPVLILTLADGGRAVEQAVTPSMARVSGGPGVGLLVILGFAFLGGLILNLMPCVLPVLSMKVLSVVGHGGAEAAGVRRGFLATAAGIVFSFMVLAGGAIVLKFAGIAVGWGIQFQAPLFLVVMAGIVVLFAANLFGLFEIPLPGFAGETARLGNGKSLGGAFATGAFATLLATPCSAPFLGTAIGFALSRGVGEILAVFAVLGLGLAMPYLLVAAWPRIATGLPRPGAWMVVLRRVLGVILLLTALWLISVLWVVAGMGATIAIGILLAGVLGALTLRRATPRMARSAGALTILCLVVALVVPGVMGGGVPTKANLAVEVEDSGIKWQPFDKVRLLNHVALGRVVFVDVTADWCVTCKVNKALVIDRGEVAARLKGTGVIAMRADWTRPNDKIAAYLRGFGRFGIPFNAVYGPAAPSGIVLSELLTESEVLAAMASAAPRALARGK